MTALFPGPVPTEWAQIADAERFSIPFAQVSPVDVADQAIEGMLAGKRTVVPGLVPKFVRTSGRLIPRSLLLPGIRIGNKLRGGPAADSPSRRCATPTTTLFVGRDLQHSAGFHDPAGFVPAGLGGEVKVAAGVDGHTRGVCRNRNLHRFGRSCG